VRDGLRSIIDFIVEYQWTILFSLTQWRKKDKDIKEDKTDG